MSRGQNFRGRVWRTFPKNHDYYYCYYYDYAYYCFTAIMQDNLR